MLTPLAPHGFIIGPPSYKSMSHEITVTIQLESDQSSDRIAKLFESLFQFGSIRESIADGLQLLDDPRLLAVAVTSPNLKESGTSAGSG